MSKLKFRAFLLIVTQLLLVTLYFSCTKSRQSAKDKYFINTNVDSLSFNDKGGVANFTVNANASLAIYINSGQNWVSYSPNDTVSSASDYKITVTVPAFNEDNGKRTTQLTIRCGDFAKDFVVRKFITITQVGPQVGPREPGIYSVKDLSDLGVAVAGNQDLSKWQDANGVINLMNDIDGGATLIPCIGAQTVASDTIGAFGGTFDGNGHTIKGTLDAAGKPIVDLFTRLAPK
jgi:hypothetical protein